MVTKADYKEMIEKKFNDSLENIMYELCVVKDVVPSEGARILGVPKDVFTYWRSKFRFGPIQRRNDFIEKLKEETLVQYNNELQNINLNREFMYGDKLSLDGFREMLERKLELLKARRITNYNSDVLSNISIDINIMALEQAVMYLDSYISGELHKEIEIEIQRLNM